MWKQEDLEFEAIPGKSSGVTVSKTKQNKKKKGWRQSSSSRVFT
jgi:hypothetical protein